MLQRDVSKQGEGGQVAVFKSSLHAFIMVMLLCMSNGIALVIKLTQTAAQAPSVTVQQLLESQAGLSRV